MKKKEIEKIGLRVNLYFPLKKYVNEIEIEINWV